MLVDNSHNTGETDYDLRSVLLRILHLPQTSVVCNSLDNADVIFKENQFSRCEDSKNLQQLFSDSFTTIGQLHTICGNLFLSNWGKIFSKVELSFQILFLRKYPKMFTKS